MPEIDFGPAKLPASGALILLIPEAARAESASGERPKPARAAQTRGKSEDAPSAGLLPGGLCQAADEATDGAIARALAATDFTGKTGQTATILAPSAGFERVIAAGLGDPAKLTPRVVEEAAGAAAALLGRAATAAILADELTGRQGAHAAFGATTRLWRFDRYHTKQSEAEKPKLGTLTILTGEQQAAREAWTGLSALAEGVALTRELVSEPANVLHPESFAERIAGLAIPGLKVEILDRAALEALGCGAILGVSQGSAREPRLVTMRWQGAGAKKGSKPLAFVGKGVTFDTGGISIKPAAGMEDMKWDMAGAGTVVGLMATLARRKARVDAVGLVGLVENMPSGTAIRPGDVITAHDGQTIEVLNTDAEGRLVLADVISYAQKTFDPRLIVDLATLTGAIIVALGHEHAGLFCNDDPLAAQLLAAGEAVGETLWRMPLGEAYDKLLRSDIADMKNIGGRPGGSVTAAQFIKRFVTDGRPWAHLDIAGMAWRSKDTSLMGKGASAYGVRLLDRFVSEGFEGVG